MEIRLKGQGDILEKGMTENKETYHKASCKNESLNKDRGTSDDSSLKHLFDHLIPSAKN